MNDLDQELIPQLDYTHVVVQDVGDKTFIRFRCLCMTTALFWEQWLKRFEPDTNPRTIPKFIAEWQELKPYGSAN